MSLKVCVIFGSRTCEHDVSIISGMQAAAALNANEYDVERVYIDREGRWFVGEDLASMAFYRDPDYSRLTQVYPAAGDQKLVLMRAAISRNIFRRPDPVYGVYDVVLPVMHGLNGEDGSLQGMLELFNVPYTSAGVLGSAIGMDKIAMKLFFRGCGFPVLDGVWFDRGRWGKERQQILDECEKKLTYPMFAKPANLGSSIGITRAVDRESLEDAIDTACSYDRRILVEQGVEDPKEVNCAAMGFSDEVEVAETEMPVTDRELLTFDEKYLRGSKGGVKGMESLSRIVPAPLSAEQTEEVRSLTRSIYRAMDLKGTVRIDFLVDKAGKIWVNEANVIPGSLAYYLWEPAGLPFGKMLDRMIEFAFKAHAEKNGSVFSFDSTILQGILNGSKGGKLRK